ncbi:uncharacterized protein LOC112539056 [Tetranychus urticae]|uniref:uncharacterized protein LOC112539056 n=1 Tax=Tetranychus urticae TaxID=32264 RepID=UPI000D658D1A|nr:uncharacterized protein LOC112539056 [Tetranychus urticae]
MKIDLNFSFFLCIIFTINSIICDDFKCTERGKVGELKVPNVLSLIDKQTGYRSSVEISSPIHYNTLVHDYFDVKNNVGYIDLEQTIHSTMSRSYYYHSTEEKITIGAKTCKNLDLTQNEKIESIKDWFEPKDIVASSDMFKDLVHLGPTVLMIYANSISDKASFIGSELIVGRAVNHWFYCSDPNGPYIDFYFDVKTSLPYRFSLYYPEWIETQEVISVNETKIVKKQVDSDSKYVYNYYMFKPLVITSDEAIQFPLGYGCARKGGRATTPLPDFGQVKKFSMDMETILTYHDSDPIKSTARVMKRGDVFSFEIQEETDFVRFIEMPRPLGRFQVDEHTGRCNYLTADYGYYETLITRWPFHQDRGFNLLSYLVMKPTLKLYYGPQFIGEIPLGPARVMKYRAPDFFADKVDAFVDYFYTQNTSDSVPSKIVFTPDRNDYYYDSIDAPTQVEVTIVNYQDSYIDFEDRFDVSGCYEEPGSFTWFQLFISNPWMSEYNMVTIKESTEEYLTSFIPITRIGDIHVQEVDSNVYVTVKLYDRVHFIETYRYSTQQTLMRPTNIMQRSKVEDCEQLCSANPDCYNFSYCDDYDCSLYASLRGIPSTEFKSKCTYYNRARAEATHLVSENYLSTIPHVLHQIRNKVSAGEFRLDNVDLSVEDLFIVNGPEEIGDISQELYTSGSRPLRAEDFPMIKTDRLFKEAQFRIEKSTLQDCFMACVNDDDCSALSYCVNTNKECILSGETPSSLKETLEDKTSHADGCNIYQKSFMNLFHEYPGKSLVLDAVSTLSNVPIGDCAKRCAQSNDFSCESFDYCQDNGKRNESVCFLHVNHIEIDKAHQINATNWKLSKTNNFYCYSLIIQSITLTEKSELDYEHKVGLSLKTKEAIVGTFDHLSLEHCASRCNSDPNCFTLEFCQSIDYDRVSDSSVPLTSCSLTNLKPSNANQTGLFEETKSTKKICSIYINHNKIRGKSKTDPQPSTLIKPPESPTKSNNLKIAFGLGTIVCLMAFAGGFMGFKFAAKKGVIS